MKLNMLVVWLSLSVLTTCSGGQDPRVVYPKTPDDLRKVVAFVGSSKNSATAVLLKSSPDGSELLTNAHVCESFVTVGGRVWLKGRSYPILAVQASTRYDLCLLKVRADLRGGVEVLRSGSRFGERILVAGHPLHMPLVIQEGYASYMFDVYPNLPWTLATSVIAQPGSSGSGVFDSQGRLIGLVAMFKNVSDQSEGGFALAVPGVHIRLFIDKESKTLPWIPVPLVEKP